MSFSNFFIDTINSAAKAGISIKILSEYSAKYKGFFDSSDCSLTVYMIDHKENVEELKNWLSVFVHETCHMDQHIEASEVWTGTSVGNLTTENIIDSWLDHHIELSTNHLNNYIDKIIACELDCEKRTVAKIKKYRLPLDTKEYIKTCNAVLYMYEVIKTTRAWTKPGKGPTTNSKVIALMPDTFQKSYKDKKIIDAIISNCYEV